MKSGPILGLVLLAVVSAVPAARADDAPAASDTPAASTAPPTCEVPESLLTTESVLKKVADSVKEGRGLNILMVGSRSSTIAASEGSAYPARMQAVLKDKLPGVAVNLSVELLPRRSAEEVAGGFVKLLEEKKPTLVVWQTGTVDAVRAIDPDDFHSAVEDGVVALQNAGVDVVLVNLQYSPRTETMISTSPYLDNMRAVAQQHDVPLFDRFAVMQHWNDQGDFDLFSPAHDVELAKRVHDCLGRALSTFIIDAAHIGAEQQN